MLRRGNPLTQTTARDPGCLIATQQQVGMKVFSSMEDLILTDLSYLDPKFEVHRMIIGEFE